MSLQKPDFLSCVLNHSLSLSHLIKSIPVLLPAFYLGLLFNPVSWPHS